MNFLTYLDGWEYACESTIPKFKDIKTTFYSKWEDFKLPHIKRQPNIINSSVGVFSWTGFYQVGSQRKFGYPVKLYKLRVFSRHE